MRQQWFFMLLLVFSTTLSAQYTEQINSNRPGMSIGAYSVGKGVVQFEAGGALRSYTHKGYNQSTSRGTLGFLSIRWGFLKEQLELTYEGAFLWDELHNKTTGTPIISKRKGFLQNFIGVKYLVYDPFRAEEEPNLYSYKANNRFRLRDLFPAISVTLGTNLIPPSLNPYPYGDVFSSLYRPFFYQNINQPIDEEPFVTLRGMVATQSHFFERWVFVTNFSYSRYLSDYPEISYILTLTHTFHPLWSIYIENQGISSDRYTDTIFRLGAAYLMYDDLQLEATLGSNTKNSPNIVFLNVGASYRLDFHKEYTTAEEREAKALKKEEKKLNKTAKKLAKQDKKRTRRARKN
ncbi:MAG: transporter [Flavobacteriaceae bacterium TMED120]|nr:MAG: transporter [Flavobacteriaceae bacterium TMED120]CAI8233712.1 MAG: Uncharacterised protein [Flavobacteriaceae bacterium]